MRTGLNIKLEVPTWLFPNDNPDYTTYIITMISRNTLCCNGTVPCVDFMDVVMGDIPYIITLCLNGTLPCVDFMDVIMGDIPYIITLCLNGTLSCVDFMGDIPLRPC